MNIVICLSRWSSLDFNFDSRENPTFKGSDKVTLEWNDDIDCSHKIHIKKRFTDEEPMTKTVNPGISNITIPNLEPESSYSTSIKKICGEFESLYSSPALNFTTTTLNNTAMGILEELQVKMVNLFINLRTKNFFDIF